MVQRVGRSLALLFHDRDTRKGWVVSSTPRPYFTPGKDPVPIVQEAGWAPGRVWTSGKSRPNGIRSPDRPARSSVVIPTEQPDPLLFIITILNVRVDNRPIFIYCSLCIQVTIICHRIIGQQWLMGRVQNNTGGRICGGVWNTASNWSEITDYNRKNLSQISRCRRRDPKREPANKVRTIIEWTGLFHPCLLIKSTRRRSVLLNGLFGGSQPVHCHVRSLASAPKDTSFDSHPECLTARWATVGRRGG